MKSIARVALRISEWMDNIAVVALSFMMLITVADVILRLFGRPILGVYEIVGLSGGIVIGFAIPFTSWKRGHVYIDILTDRLPVIGKNIMMICTRIVVIILFFFIGINLFSLAAEYRTVREVSQTIRLPLYPFVYAIGVASFAECYVILCDILKIAGGDYE